MIPAFPEYRLQSGSICVFVDAVASACGGGDWWQFGIYTCLMLASNTLTSWHAAELACREQSGTLVKITTTTLNQHIRGKVRQSNTIYLCVVYNICTIYYKLLIVYRRDCLTYFLLNRVKCGSIVKYDSDEREECDLSPSDMQNNIFTRHSPYYPLPVA